ncbi:MAG: hypothetical protein ACFCUT_09795 [Kiloniellaceae bacterium]
MRLRKASPAARGIDALSAGPEIAGPESFDVARWPQPRIRAADKAKAPAAPEPDWRGQWRLLKYF